MSTQYLKFKGPCKWARVFKPDEKFNRFSVEVYLDEVNLDKYLKSGIRVQIKEDDDGKYVRFSRPMNKMIKGQAVELGAPEVTQGKVKMEETIGNGSIVEVTVDVYETVKGKGHTLRKVDVLEHVVYEKQID